jgi:hypothetical protein
VALGAPLSGAVMDKFSPAWGFPAVAGVGLLVALLVLPTALRRHRAEGSAAAEAPAESSAAAEAPATSQAVEPAPMPALAGKPTSSGAARMTGGTQPAVFPSPASPEPQATADGQAADQGQAQGRTKVPRQRRHR